MMSGIMVANMIEIAEKKRLCIKGFIFLKLEIESFRLSRSFQSLQWFSGAVQQSFVTWSSFATLSTLVSAYRSVVSLQLVISNRGYAPVSSLTNKWSHVALSKKHTKLSTTISSHFILVELGTFS